VCWSSTSCSVIRSSLPGRSPSRNRSAGGRLRVGLGIGDKFSRLDHQILGVRFPSFEERVRVLDRCCQVLPALWRGEAVTEPLLGLRGAALGPTNGDLPPIIVGGGNRKVIDVAVRHAQGWNLLTQEPEEFRRRVEVVASVEAMQGRAEALSRSVYFFIDRVVRDLKSVLAEFQAAGAEEMMLVVMRSTGESIRDLARNVL
jgi:alkanesulfonate monooxygenase SsuD/methylene tetrahydromethanopterin reductase-like flavin-dependent oxidoreductase (luciferase family)